MAQFSDLVRQFNQGVVPARPLGGGTPATPAVPATPVAMDPRGLVPVNRPLSPTLTPPVVPDRVNPPTRTLPTFGGQVGGQASTGYVAPQRNPQFGSPIPVTPRVVPTPGPPPDLRGMTAADRRQAIIDWRRKLMESMARGHNVALNQGLLRVGG